MAIPGTTHTLRLSMVGCLTVVAAAIGLISPSTAVGLPARPAAPALTGVAAPGLWVDSWAASAHSSAAEAAPPTFQNQTLRLIVRLHAGGDRVRLRLSNSFGDRPVTFNRAWVGIRGAGASLVARTNRPVTFHGGDASTTVAAGKEVYSDQVRLSVKAGQDLAVSLYVANATGPATWHRSALQTSYVSTGNHTWESAATAFASTVGNWFFLDAVSVRSSTAPGTIVALGDSITDGAGSAANSNHRWPDILSGRLLAQPRGLAYSVLNEGIGGNRVLADTARNGQSALHRLDRDVLSRRGLRYVILLEGINDLRGTGDPAIAEEIIAGYRQIITRVHAKGVKVFGGTLTPVKGSGRYNGEMERRRQAVNSWIRTSGQFDGVVDFDKATQDPADPLRFLPRYDSGDHLHPNDAGYEAMGNAIDLGLFRTGIPSARSGTGRRPTAHSRMGS
jgi:lysophospholipase L1-like esterase